MDKEAVIFYNIELYNGLDKMINTMKWLLFKRPLLKFKLKGVYISPKARVYNSNISDYVKIMEDAFIANTYIGRFSYICSGRICNCEIRSFCSIGPGVRIGLGKHPTNFISTNPVFFNKHCGLPYTFADKDYFVNEIEKILIGNDVWIGANVVILDGVHIGDGAIVGAGAVVTKDVEPYSIVAGVPAKFIRKRFSEDQIRKLKEIEWWNWSIDKLKINSKYFHSNLTDNEFEEFLRSCCCTK